MRAVWTLETFNPNNSIVHTASHVKSKFDPTPSDWPSVGPLIACLIIVNVIPSGDFCYSKWWLLLFQVVIIVIPSGDYCYSNQIKSNKSLLFINIVTSVQEWNFFFHTFQVVIIVIPSGDYCYSKGWHGGVHSSGLAVVSGSGFFAGVKNVEL